jgi:hypothetical protein
MLVNRIAVGLSVRSISGESSFDLFTYGFCVDNDRIEARARIGRKPIRKSKQR